MQKSFGLSDSVLRNQLGIAQHSPSLFEELEQFDEILAAQMADAPPRLSGESQINHPRRIVKQMLEDGIFDRDMLLAALFHDAVEDGFMMLDGIGELCGEAVRKLVEGETKLALKEGEAKSAREIRNLIRWISAACEDPRVIILKAYDNLDNWRDQDIFLRIPGKEDKPREHAEETLFVYAPLMDALGCWWMRVRLEDKALQYYDKDYAQHKRFYEAILANYQQEAEEIKGRIQIVLQAAKIEANVLLRTRCFSEIWRLANNKKTSFEDILRDPRNFIYYVSVEVKNQPEQREGALVQCYTVRGLIEAASIFIPLVQGGLNNLVVPRENGYRAMHAYAKLRDSRRMMIGYTTEDFNLYNLQGVVAHGARFGFTGDWAKGDLAWLGRLRALAARENWLTAKEIRDFIPSAISNITVTDQFGAEYKVENEATVLDYAVVRGFSVVGEIKVNGMVVDKYDHVLRNGDRVEISEKNGTSVHPLWLNSVRTHASAATIRQRLQGLGKAKLNRLGIETLDQLLMPVYLSWADIKDKYQMRETHARVMAEYKDRIKQWAKQLDTSVEILQRIDALPILVGLGEIDAQAFIRKFDEIYQASLKERFGQAEKEIVFILRCALGRDRKGVQGEIGAKLAAVGISIQDSYSHATRNGPADLVYAFVVVSSIQEQQIKNIIRSVADRIEYSGRLTEDLELIDLKDVGREKNRRKGRR